MTKIDVRLQRKKQILDLFQVAGRSELTTSDVAKVLGLSTSSWLRGVLYEMAEDGALVMRSAPHRKNSYKILFALNPDARKKRGG